MDRDRERKEEQRQGLLGFHGFWRAENHLEKLFFFSVTDVRKRLKVFVNSAAQQRKRKTHSHDDRERQATSGQSAAHRSGRRCSERSTAERTAGDGERAQRISQVEEGKLRLEAPREAPLLLHRPDRDGDPELAEQKAHSEWNLPVPAGPLHLLQGIVPGMEKLCQAQPVPERVLHQAAQGSRQTREGTLLDHRPGQRVYVRGGLLSPQAARIPEEMPSVESHVPDDGWYRVWNIHAAAELWFPVACGLVNVPQQLQHRPDG